MKRAGAGGFTLVELLIAVTIGLLLTVLISQVFVSSKRAYSTTDDLSRMQENMRYANDVLGRTIRMASYMSSPSHVPISYDGMIGQFEGVNTALDGLEGSTATASDSLTVNYQGTADGGTVDCLGNAIAAGAMGTSIFSIQTVNNVPSLVCQNSVGGAASVLIADVENMQILYGEEAGSVWNADRYVRRALVNNVNRVISVRIAMLFRTPTLNMRTTPDTNSYSLLDATVAAPTGVDATRIRRVMTATYTLRNRSP